ncbi:hypothetical protein FA13DRAFT_1037945 [Coprinellus micaceus]|uniref:Uncharacterized protein n=1 Tax=Coprinellus micaceus TaxID=71717 RepID=A0A4Y7SX56_COPMI|nr:hypothetical protein FA13DRAFT_1037945 [Coprinellus micaceus]
MRNLGTPPILLIAWALERCRISPLVHWTGLACGLPTSPLAQVRLRRFEQYSLPMSRYSKLTA